MTATSVASGNSGRLGGDIGVWEVQRQPSCGVAWSATKHGVERGQVSPFHRRLRLQADPIAEQGHHRLNLAAEPVNHGGVASVEVTRQLDLIPLLGVADVV